MKTEICLGLLGALALIAGCVSTVTGDKTGAVPFTKDQVVGRYERPVSQVFDAAKDVIKFQGTLLKESTLHSETNAVQTIEAKVNQKNVWVRVEQVDPKVTAVTVQVRGSGGGADVDLAHELEKRIALKLAQ